MDATLVGLLQGLLSLVVAGLGWWLKTLHNQLRETEKTVQAHKVEVARDYASSAALERAKQEQADATRDVFSAINSVREHMDERFNQITQLLVSKGRNT